MKMFRKLLFFVLISFAGSMSLNAQDIHFSQFYMSPLNLNPAMTGVMNCNVRLVANYRNQWASALKANAFSTYSASYDQRIPIGRYDYLGVGGTFWGDKAGQSEFATIQGRISAAYSKRMGGGRNKSHYLVVGVDGAAAQRSINFQKLQWGAQHDGNGAFDPTKSSGEDFDRPNFIFADLSAGLLWFSVLNKNNNFYLGAAYAHLNRANQSFDTGDFIPLYSKFTFHAGGEFLIGDRLGLVPGVVAFIQGPSFQVNAGTSFRFLLGKTRDSYQSFQLGAWTRLTHRLDESIWGDAIIISTRFDYDNFGIGFSYDVNISGLSAVTQGNGAFEFSLLYKICGPQNRNVYCPNF
ncbi:MAG TPA: type IX secretion system membrane protein PorP/SprF [Saprospiraceae bacterium]|nr:type IX secretion system membrane protein PorP/SprF [Saprospiraceae bacterium]